MGPDELRKIILDRRASDEARARKCPPDNVRIGPLTATAMDRARWRGQNEFPSSQHLADEVERVLSFATTQAQFARYLGPLRGSKSQFDSALLELRVAFFLRRNQFEIIQWEPVGSDAHRGEYLIQGPSRVSTFVEVKSPGWEGELSTEERRAGRLRQPKDLYCEARSVAPWQSIQFAVHKAYEKFAPSTPNLLIIADDLFLSLAHSTNIHAGMALYEKHNNGCFTDEKYANLGGVGIFWIENDGRRIGYEMKLFLNPYALTSTGLPADIRLGFHGKSGPLVASTENPGPAVDTPLQRWLEQRD